jgi:hypothetical protein
LSGEHPESSATLEHSEERLERAVCDERSDLRWSRGVAGSELLTDPVSLDASDIELTSRLEHGNEQLIKQV